MELAHLVEHGIRPKQNAVSSRIGNARDLSFGSDRATSMSRTFHIWIHSADYFNLSYSSDSVSHGWNLHISKHAFKIIWDTMAKLWKGILKHPCPEGFQINKSRIATTIMSEIFPNLREIKKFHGSYPYTDSIFNLNFWWVKILSEAPLIVSCSIATWGTTCNVILLWHVAAYPNSKCWLWK